LGAASDRLRQAGLDLLSGLEGCERFFELAVLFQELAAKNISLRGGKTTGGFQLNFLVEISPRGGLVLQFRVITSAIAIESALGCRIIGVGDGLIDVSESFLPIHLLG